MRHHQVGLIVKCPAGSKPPVKQVQKLLIFYHHSPTETPQASANQPNPYTF